MTTYSEASELAAQVHQDELIYNALNPGYSAPLIPALQWGGVAFAEYAFGAGSLNLGAFLPTATSSGDADAFITGVYSNALGRAATATDISFYEHVISTAADAVKGFALVVTYIGLSPESQAHNAHLGVLV